MRVADPNYAAGWGAQKMKISFSGSVIFPPDLRAAITEQINAELAAGTRPHEHGLLGVEVILHQSPIRQPGEYLRVRTVDIYPDKLLSGKLIEIAGWSVF